MRDEVEEIQAVEDLEGESPAAGNLMDSKTSHLDDILKKKLEAAFDRETSHFVLHDLAKIASEHSAIDLAYAASRLPLDLRPVIFDNLKSAGDKISFLSNTDTTTRVVILRHIGDEKAKMLIEKMPIDDAVFILDDMSERRFRRVIEIIEPSKAAKILEIKRHGRHTAARLMSNQFFSFQKDTTIGSAIETIRNNPGAYLSECVFVLNRQHQVQGFVPTRVLLINSHDLPLKQVMRPIEHTVHMDASREEVVDIVGRYKIPILPVVDDEGVLSGVIFSDDALEAMEDFTDETMAHMAGTTEKVGENESMGRKFLYRLPWLFITLIAGILNGAVMSSFETRAGSTLTFVLFFVPLITGLSGNIGLQCSTVLVRGMATGMLSAGGKREAVQREILTGLSNGLFFGIVTTILVALLNSTPLLSLTLNPYAVGLIVGVGLIGGCLAGTVLGVISPLFFARMGVDPAISAGPIITACNDFLSMAIYFLIALGLGHFLF